MCPNDEDFLAYHPDTKADDRSGKNGLFCFKDVTRPCGADCMAFIPAGERPSGADYKGQWASCIELVNMHKTGKHLTIIAQGLNTIVNHQQDTARNSQKPPSITVPGVPR